jgi:hypothetical protein
MSNIEAHEEAELWIRDTYLPKEYGQTFRPKSLPLQSRGESKFSAVSDDGEVVAAICTRRAYNSTHKVDKDVLMKVQSDALKILWLETTPAKRLMLFTDPDMVRVIKEEKRKDHFPKEIQIVRVKLPKGIQEKLEGAGKSGAEPTM